MISLQPSNQASHHKNRLFLVPILLLLSIISACNTTATPPETDPLAAKKPNYILIFCDDLGYGDIGPFGAQQHQTPHLDRMAAEGMKFTDFYVSSGVCTPSRSSLMTGCYPRRVDMHVNAYPPGKTEMRQVLFAIAHKGLNPAEVTVAEVLKEEDYATGIIGKWHLGDQPEFLPTRQGFDYYFGIPYSNDMGAGQFEGNPPLPLLRNEQVIEAPVDQSTLTKRYAEEAVKFITEKQDQPFFLYLPHTMPHNPVYASEAFAGKSANSTYGDAVEEIDWSVGQILNTLDSLGLSEQTLVVFTSDNGAAGNWGGSNAPLSGYKGSTLEGGMRVPCLMRWKGTVPAGTVQREMATTMDILPTFAALSGANLPQDRIIDGKDIRALMMGEDGARTPHEVFYYYQVDQLQAVRAGEWKLHLPLEKRRMHVHKDGFEKSEARLYNLRTDMRERKNVAEDHPEVVARLLQYAQAAREDLGDMDEAGKNQRTAAIVEKPQPLIMKSSAGSR